MRVVGQGGDGGTVDIGFGCLSGMFERNDDVLFICYDNEAYMNTGVQRSGATPPAARTATTPAVGRRAGQRVRPGQERAADRDGARDPVRGHSDGGGAARPRGQGRARDDASTGRATCTSWSPARSAGAPVAPATDQDRPARERRPACSRSSRPSTARSPASRRSAGRRPVEEYLRLQKRYAPPVRARAPAPRSSRGIQAIADRNIKRFGLLPRDGALHDAKPLRHHAGRRLQPGQQDRRAGAASGRSTSSASRRATTPARRARTSSNGSTTPKRATTRPPGGQLVEDNPFPA